MANFIEVTANGWRYAIPLYQVRYVWKTKADKATVRIQPSSPGPEDLVCDDTYESVINQMRAA